jgi:putative tryptophan/tyrosine transport system substrate-binding protein
MMNSHRRLLLAVLAAAGFAAPRLTRGQQGRVRLIGFLAYRGRPVSLETDPTYGEFVRAMQRLGYIENRNLRIEWRFADSRTERLPALAAELVKLNPEVIVTHTTPAAQAVQAATRTIPIIANVGDPLVSGLVKSLARPGGNLTGTSQVSLDATTKQVELLKTTLPQLSHLGLLINPTGAVWLKVVEGVEQAGKSMGVTVLVVRASTPDEIERGFETFRKEGTQAVIIANDGLFNGRREQLAALALKHRLPSISPFSDQAAAGGFMSYGNRQSEVFRLLAVYADKILKGAKPGDMPFEQIARFELVLNLKTAKLLGIKIPHSVLQRVDRVIE